MTPEQVKATALAAEVFGEGDDISELEVHGKRYGTFYSATVERRPRGVECDHGDEGTAWAMVCGALEALKRRGPS